MIKLITLATLLLTCAACTFNPIAYDELRQQEHQDHLKQNGY